MERRLRVFVSHSSHAPGACDWLEAFVNDLGLGEDWVEVLVDRELIDAGDDWRKAINAMLAECDAAVVLITPDALTSTWVLKEATILRFRHDQDPGFPLLPIASPDVDPEELKDNRLWDPVDLPDLQFLAGDSAAATAAAIKARLAQLVGQDRLTPLDLLADDIAGKLTMATPGRVQWALDKLNESVPFSVGDKHQRLAYAIARWMLRQPPPALARIAETLDLLGDTFPAADARQILDLVAPIWVDLDAASWFVRANWQHSDFRDIAITCRQPSTTLPQFVHRAYMPVRSPLFKLLNGVTGGAQSDDIAQELRAVLGPVLKINRPLYDAEIDEKLNQIGARLYVALPLPDDRRVVAALQARFSHVTFVFFAAPEECPPDGGSPPATGVRWVSPAIEPDLEDKVYEDYVTAWVKFPP